METKHWIATATLVVLLLAETWFPFFRQLTTFRERFVHDLRNVVVGVLNALFGSMAVVTLFVGVDHWATANQVGLLRQFDTPSLIKLLLAVLLLDIWTYWWHRLNHVVPILWRLHRTHHTDLAMDVSTGVRFHLGEILLSWLARLLILPLLGISLVQLASYESLLLPVILLHHSNIRLPRWFDYGLLAVIVTPAMHRVHHSRIVAETNSNYGSLLPWWDYLFRTLRLHRDAENIQYGVDEFASHQWQTLTGIAKTPFVQPKATDSERTQHS